MTPIFDECLHLCLCFCLQVWTGGEINLKSPILLADILCWTRPESRLREPRETSRERTVSLWHSDRQHVSSSSPLYTRSITLMSFSKHVTHIFLNVSSEILTSPTTSVHPLSPGSVFWFWSRGRATLRGCGWCEEFGISQLSESSLLQ